MTFMVEECCHAIILSLTKDVLVSTPRPMKLDEAIGFLSQHGEGKHSTLQPMCCLCARKSPGRRHSNPRSDTIGEWI